MEKKVKDKVAEKTDDVKILVKHIHEDPKASDIFFRLSSAMQHAIANVDKLTSQAMFIMLLGMLMILEEEKLIKINI